MSDVMPGLSIVVPAHNSGPRLRETLRQLARELGRDDIEVIIVENGSSDDTWEVAEDSSEVPGGFPSGFFDPMWASAPPTSRGSRRRGATWFFSPPTTFPSVSPTFVPGNRSATRLPW